MSEPFEPGVLDWLAFQYVTDALPIEQAAAFEARLLECQASREAVARAVELTLTARAACGADDFRLPQNSVALPPVRKPKTWRKIVGTAIAASIALALGWQAAVWFLPDGDPADFGSRLAMSPSGEITGAGRDLALAWSESRLETIPALAGEETSDALEIDAPEITPADDVEAPSWMLAAVEGMLHPATAEDAAGDGALPDADSDAAPSPANRNEG